MSIAKNRKAHLDYWSNKRRSRFPGVCWDEYRWVARIGHDGSEGYKKKGFPPTPEGEEAAARQYTMWLAEAAVSA